MCIGMWSPKVGKGDGDFVSKPTLDELRKAGEEALARYTGIRNLAVFIAHLIIEYNESEYGVVWYDVAQKVLDAQKGDHANEAGS